MSLECLPEVIRESLQTITARSNLSEGVEYEITKSATNEISSACNVRLKDEVNVVDLFVKYLNNSAEQSLVCFNNEIVFYGQIMKLFEKIANRSKETINFAPMCLDVGEGYSPFIIMKDLMSSGYLPFDGKEMGLDRAGSVLHQLGRFHAFSFAAREKEPLGFRKATSQLKEVMFSNERRTTLGKLFIRSIHDVLKLAKQSFPADSVYAQKFAMLTLNIFEKMTVLIQGDKEDQTFKVLTHGDLWPNNILSSHDPENETTTTFVDYHACRLASPVHDLQLLLLVGLDQSTRERNRSELIRRYHTSLCQTLQNLDCDPLRSFPISALQKQLEKQSQFAVATALVGLPLFMNDGNLTGEGKVDDVEKLMELLRQKKSMKCKNKMLEIVIDAVGQGYL